MNILTINSTKVSGRDAPSGVPGREGFALPAAILALAVVAILLAGGFHMANQEQRIGMSAERGTQAFYVAEDGLTRALVGWRNWGSSFSGAPAWTFGDPVQFDGPRGQAVVRAMKVDDNLFYLQSQGQIDEGGALSPGARRALGLMVRRTTADIAVDAALTTQGDVQLRGSSEIHGEDQVPSGWNHCPTAGATRPGVVVGAGGSVEVQGGNEEQRLTGDPPWEEDEDVGDHTFEEFGGMTWNDLVQQADIRIPDDGTSGGTYTISDTEATLDGDGNCDAYDIHNGTGDMWNWGYPYERDDPDATLAPCHDWYPIIYVDGDARIQSNGYGQGILLVEGNVDLRGDFNFYGVIIAQGTLETQGGANPRIVGGAIARNADLDLQDYVGSSVIQYSSCAVTEAVQNAAGLTSVAPLARRSWMDVTGAGF